MTFVLFLFLFAIALVVVAFYDELFLARRDDNAKVPKETAMDTKTEKPGAWKFCPVCAGGLVTGEFGGKERLHCESCSFVHWDNPKGVAVVLIPKGNGIVLIKRKLAPQAGKMALPGGFVDKGEDPWMAAVREAKEETHLDIEVDRLLWWFNVASSNQTLFFFLAKPVTEMPVAGDDAAEATVYELDEIPDSEMAFSSHKDAIAIWVKEVSKS